MKIMIVDDEHMAIRSLEDVLCRVLGDDIEVIPAENGQIALELARVSAPDIVFLDIEMPGMSGMELAKRLKDLCPATNLVIVTAYSEYALKAWKLHVSDYLLKPADEEDVRIALDNLRIRPDYMSSEHRLRVQCFGNFEVFNGDRILQFGRSRAKEMLDCDYYRFLAMDPVAINSYQSEFMSQYSWAEMLIPTIENTVRK